MCLFWISWVYSDLEENILSLMNNDTKKATVILQWTSKRCCNINFQALNLKLSPNYTKEYTFIKFIERLHIFKVDFAIIGLWRLTLSTYFHLEMNRFVTPACNKYLKPNLHLWQFFSTFLDVYSSTLYHYFT